MKFTDELIDSLFLKKATFYKMWLSFGGKDEQNQMVCVRIYVCVFTGSVSDFVCLYMYVCFVSFVCLCMCLYVCLFVCFHLGVCVSLFVCP